ncbi:MULTISPECIES: helix-turn-helix domain-containing protein [Methanoculleus]
MPRRAGAGLNAAPPFFTITLHGSHIPNPRMNIVLSLISYKYRAYQAAIVETRLNVALDTCRWLYNTLLEECNAANMPLRMQFSQWNSNLSPQQGAISSLMDESTSRSAIGC